MSVTLVALQQNLTFRKLEGNLDSGDSMRHTEKKLERLYREKLTGIWFVIPLWFAFWTVDTVEFVFNYRCYFRFNFNRLLCWG